MKVEIKSDWGDDLAVINNAKVSFDKEEDWAGFFELSEKQEGLIRFLARGMTSEEMDDFLDDLEWDFRSVDEGSATREDSIRWVKEMLWRFRRTPEHYTCFANGIGAKFRITAPIPIMRQIFKHKIGTVENEVSRRYVKSDPEFFVPEFREAAANVKQGSSSHLHPRHGFWKELYIAKCNSALDEYKAMVDDGICPEQARFILPQGMETTSIISNSLYGWANFYNKRTDPHAQAEVRYVAKEVGEWMASLFPISWKYLTEPF